MSFVSLPLIANRMSKNENGSASQAAMATPTAPNHYAMRNLGSGQQQCFSSFEGHWSQPTIIPQNCGNISEPHDMQMRQTARDIPPEYWHLSYAGVNPQCAMSGPRSS
jgi:hypothetical protein